MATAKAVAHATAGVVPLLPVWSLLAVAALAATVLEYTPCVPLLPVWSLLAVAALAATVLEYTPCNHTAVDMAM